MGYRYIGAKTKVITNVISKIKEIAPPNARVCDLMTGTGAVAAALRRNDFRIIAVDVMTYSYHHARTSLLFTTPPEFKFAKAFIKEFGAKEQENLFPSTPYQEMIEALNNLPSKKGYFWREFSLAGKPKNTIRPRNYFSPANAKKIDSLRCWIKELSRTRQITDLEHSLLLHDLIMAANNVANIAGTYGHYLTRLTGRANDPIRLKVTNLEMQKDSGRHMVLKGYAEDLASSIACDVCYIDPPYMKRQYAANYHILETLAREDEPEAVGISGLRPWRDQYSNFCTKTKIRESFREIFKTMECENFLISYSQDGLLTIKQFEEFLSEFGNIEVSAFTNKRFKSNNSQLKPELTEYLIWLKVAAPANFVDTSSLAQSALGAI